MRRVTNVGLRVESVGVIGEVRADYTPEGDVNGDEKNPQRGPRLGAGQGRSHAAYDAAGAHPVAIVFALPAPIEQYGHVAGQARADRERKEASQGDSTYDGVLCESVEANHAEDQVVEALMAKGAREERDPPALPEILKAQRVVI